MSVFWLLPTTIFENTTAGLSEEEKSSLFVQGASEHWLIRQATPDLLEIVSQPEIEATVILRLFRNAGGKSVVAAVGTDTGPMCATELWSVDGKGRATPLDTPEEPDILDFFAPGAHVPPDVTASLPFCVQPEGLEVRPMFWTATGLAHVMVDNAVFYVWTGKRFSKRVVPLPPYPSPTVDEPQGDAPVYALPDDFPANISTDIPAAIPADIRGDAPENDRPQNAGLLREKAAYPDDAPPALDSDGLPLSLTEPQPVPEAAPRRETPPAQEHPAQ